MTNRALTAFMLCMTMKVVSAAGSGTVVIQEPYGFSMVVSEPPDEDESPLADLLACRLELLQLGRCIAWFDVAGVLEWSNCSRATCPLFSGWANFLPRRSYDSLPYP